LTGGKREDTKKERVEWGNDCNMEVGYDNEEYGMQGNGIG
jgi:hypothetical protein